MVYDVLAPAKLIAGEYRRTESNGRSRPLRVDCVAEDGTRRECIVKLRAPGVQDGNPWALCLSREVVGAILARRLGLRVPDYGVVWFTPDFIRASANTAEGPRIAANEGPNFASFVVDAALEITGTDRLPRELEPWANLLTFDAFSFNADRTIGNPNVLWDGDDLHLIDHGMLAPTWTAAADGLAGGSLFDDRYIPLHVSYGIIRSRGASFDHVRLAWAREVTAAFLRWAIDQVPAAWATGPERRELLDFLSARAGIADGQVGELRRVVQ